ncbi:hypothetical protein TWF970_004820 [Orbilia oligospora]|uniref:Uncharacterized protein n=1 Tax=Orbilia oligospora TaxID=2813651 RepID=A0A7C8RCT4_ORBOL|nr:hypothetical protein TWF970_004820 [Orbilia oligospora]
MLIRRLLINPELGERFKKLSFTYHPRRCSYPQTWALQWHWTTEEDAKLKQLCQNWGISAAYKWISDGIYGNSIFPLLLCYTTNLKSLDLGYGVDGLSNLREFTFWGLELGDVCENCPEREMIEFVLKVLLLPHLKVARVGRRWCFDEWGVKAAMSTIGNSGPGKSRPTKMVPADGRSGIKHLELRYEELEKEGLEMFAKFTRKLESLELVLGRDATMEEGEKVAGFFLENNKETLTNGRVVIRMGHTDDFPDPWYDDDNLGPAHYFYEDE